MSTIHGSLKVIASRWNKVRLLAALVQGIVFGALLPFFLLLLSRWMPILYSKWIAAVLWLLGIVIVLFMRWLKRMSMVDAAKLVDVELGEDSVLTAMTLEQKDQQSMMGQLVMEQAVRSAQQYEQELLDRIPIKRGWNSKKWIYLMALTIIAVGLLFSLPNEQDVVAKQIKQGEELKEELSDQLEELKEEIEQSQLEEDEKEGLLSTLDELLQQLQLQDQLEASNRNELEEALQQLKELTEQKQEQKEQLRQLQEGLEQHQSLQGLQKTMNEAAKQQGAEQQQRIREALKELTEEQAEALNELAAQLAEQQKELAASLQEGANELSQGEMSEQTTEQLTEQLSQLLSASDLSAILSNAGAALSQKLSDLSSALSSLDPSLSQSLANAVQQYEASESGEAGEAEGEAGNGQNEGDGSGQGEGNSGQNGGQGESGGQGSGAGGGQSGGQGSGGAGGQSGGRGSGAGGGQGGSGAGSSPGNHATITTPRIEGESEVSVDGGPSSGGQVISGGISPIIEGQQGNYSEVFRQYEAEAKDSLNRSTLPSHMQSKVQQYFDSIQPQ